ncbi:hypothetical protein [Sphingomonas sp. M1-B02]|uniref:hypothetical protein n=1 Tax=Sphingomonas sp. M1-B02 TaxID=3114300 RepID=UPI00223F7FC5|nr:hypothetical protein [Sphingomonas sp. S6-11]UZK64838.1 hypothetical protein OKW87_09860 [Sphingomonas sp. S6-11]
MRFVPLFALLALSTPAFAQETPSAGAHPQAAKPADKPICRRINTTGTIMGGKKVCHSKAEWATIDGSDGNDGRDNRRAQGNDGQSLNRN